MLEPTHNPLLNPITKPFQRLQQALLKAPALHLPDLTHPFSLYVTEKVGFALGVLGHQLGPSFAHVAHLSNKLDLTIQGWAPCIHILAATPYSRVKKLTFGSHITVFSSHNLSQLLTYKGLQTLPPSRVLSFQVVLIEVPHSPSNHACLLIFPIFFLDQILTTPYLTPALKL